VANLNGEPLPEPSFSNKNQSAPLFITWKKANGDLRGCIGNFGDLHLGSGIRDYALIAALEDTRFEPVSLDEVPELVVSVSILINFEEAKDAFDWDVGKHGIRISFKDLSSGRTLGATYLPEVASEQGWNKSQALEALIRKAGLQGRITDDLLRNVRLTRYESSKAKLAFGQ